MVTELRACRARSRMWCRSVNHCLVALSQPCHCPCQHHAAYSGLPNYDGLLAAPVIRILVSVVFGAEEKSSIIESSDDGEVAVGKHVQSLKLCARFCRELASVVDCSERGVRVRA